MTIKSIKRINFHFKKFSNQNSFSLFIKLYNLKTKINSRQIHAKLKPIIFKIKYPNYKSTKKPINWKLVEKFRNKVRELFRLEYSNNLN